MRNFPYFIYVNLMNLMNPGY